MLVVDVLPWLPAIAILLYGLIRVPSISALGIIVNPDSLAYASSGFFLDIADEATTKSVFLISLGS